MPPAIDTLPDDPGTLKAMLIAERPEQIIKVLQRQRVGRRAETLPEDQRLLGLEEVEQTAAADKAAEETAAPAGRTERVATRRANQGGAFVTGQSSKVMFTGNKFGGGLNTFDGDTTARWNILAGNAGMIEESGVNVAELGIAGGSAAGGYAEAY